VLIKPTIIPSLLPSVNPDKKIVNVNNSILGRIANIYPKTIAIAVKVLTKAIRKDFFSSQTECFSFSEVKSDVPKDLLDSFVSASISKVMHSKVIIDKNVGAYRTCFLFLI